jgi:thiol:disulfide interchange protein
MGSMPQRAPRGQVRLISRNARDSSALRYAREVLSRRTLLVGAAIAIPLAMWTACRRTHDVAQCSVEIATEQLWVDTSDADLERSLAAARSCARMRGTQVLLEFVAPWCADCREMTRLDATPEVARVLRERYERVRVNVGNWDRHAVLRERFGIDRIAAYVVLDTNGDRVAQTVLEPITGGRGPITATQWIAWLSSPR